jgi:hypothetical protein
LFTGIDGEVGEVGVVDGPGDVPGDVSDGDAGESLQAEAASATAPAKTTAHRCRIE